MSTTNITVPVSLEENVISASLNASMIFNFLMGIYTMVYGGTVYLCLSRMAIGVNRRILVWSISVLHIICFVEFIIQWYTLDLEIVTNGSTREWIYISIEHGGLRWVRVLMDFLRYLCVILSDAFLVWRCFDMWGGSIRVVFVPLILIALQFCFLIAGTVLDGLTNTINGSRPAELSNEIATVFILVSFAVTAVTTSLIGYRLNEYSNAGGKPTVKRAFSRLIGLATDSAVLLTVSLLAETVVKVISLTKHDSFLGGAEYYSEAVLSVITGMAPTISVARIAFAYSRPAIASTVTRVSGLQFGSQPRSDGTQADVNASSIAVEVTSRQKASLRYAGENA